MTFPLEGGCDCREVRYRIQTKPLFVHCCHCRWCQRESGASFALNAMIETERLEVLTGKIDRVHTPSASGKGQKIARCFTASKQPWVVLPPGMPAVPEYYEREKYWPRESLERRKAYLEKAKSWS